MLLLEALFRFGSIGVFCAIGILILRDGRHIYALRMALPLIVTMTCLFLTTGSENLRINGAAAIPLRLLDMLNFIFVWWFGLALFDDDFRLGAREWLVAVLFTAVVAPVRLANLGFDLSWGYRLDILGFIVTLVLMGHLAYHAVIGLREDLVESRRKLRVGFAIAIALVVVTSTVTERVAYTVEADPFVSLFITYTITFFLGLWAVLWLMRLNQEALATQALPARASSIDTRDVEIHRKLVNVMEHERAFAQHGLTIGMLASSVDIPVHQLRILINRSMGYRNFSAFLNHYRLSDVKQALADPKNSRLPILTIALNAGFSSLAPFNRAFKMSFNMTPTDFRGQCLEANANELSHSVELTDQN
ncbi:MAG: AraC-like DNA-binding protein [Oceanicoccus sp.]|jgi:AraC-like DNA-binding protein